MELFEAIGARRSIRAYTDEAVPEEKIMQILEAGRLAPSWKNWQCWKFILVSDKELRLKLGEAVNNNPNALTYQNAPYFIVVCGDPEQSGKEDGKEYYMTDCGITLDHMTLAATALGLGTCWIGLFEEAPVKELLGIPETIKVVALTPVGVPAKNPKPRPRKDLSEMLYKNKWGE